MRPLTCKQLCKRVQTSSHLVTWLMALLVGACKRPLTAGHRASLKERVRVAPRENPKQNQSPGKTSRNQAHIFSNEKPQPRIEQTNTSGDCGSSTRK